MPAKPDDLISKYVSVSADGSKGVKPIGTAIPIKQPTEFQYPQMDRRV